MKKKLQCGVEFPVDIHAPTQSTSSVPSHDSAFEFSPSLAPAMLEVGCASSQTASGSTQDQAQFLSVVPAQALEAKDSVFSLGSKTSETTEVEQVKRKPRGFIRVFRCELDAGCHQQFSSVDHLFRHERTHTKDKPFKCHCGKGFACMKSWESHQKNKHRDEAEANMMTRDNLNQVKLALKVRNDLRKPELIRKADLLGAQLRDQSLSGPPRTPQVGAVVDPTESLPELDHAEPLPLVVCSTSVPTQNSFADSICVVPSSSINHSEPRPSAPPALPSTPTLKSSEACSFDSLLTPLRPASATYATGSRYPPTTGTSHQFSDYSVLLPSPNYGASTNTPSIQLEPAYAYQSLRGTSAGPSYATLAGPVSMASTMPAPMGMFNDASLMAFLSNPSSCWSRSPPGVFQPSRQANLWPGCSSVNGELQMNPSNWPGQLLGVYQSVEPALSSTMGYSATPVSVPVPQYWPSLANRVDENRLVQAPSTYHSGVDIGLLTFPGNGTTPGPSRTPKRSLESALGSTSSREDPLHKRMIRRKWG